MSPFLLGGADGEGQGQAMAQLFPTRGEEAGGGRQPGFPCGAETGTFHLHPTTAVGKEAPSGAGHRHPAQQGTRRPAMALGTSRTMWDSMEGALVVLCALLLCCSPPLAGCHQVTLFPAMLTRPAGSSATFICNISMENSSSEFNLNWYQKTNNSSPQKIAGFIRNIPQKKMEKYQLFNNTPVFKMEILNLHQNDSGFYYCGLITFSHSDKVVESNHSQLVVTEALEKTNTVEEPDKEESSPPDHVKAVLLGSLLLSGVIVLLLFGYIIINNRKADVQKPSSGNTPAEEVKPPMVDYGVLEFQRDPRSQVPLETCPAEQTEYATIVFPEEKPVTPERGKRHKDERMWQLPSQPC
ncbi:programmed cell death protein 1 [Numida meleagris]|uniref:programmed cell death protein 1 n=1 Tax=Numida meleagris TaxID=8996 RepID=UPI000B3DA84B|nr:programmed cell death protein 1 [Numida meleagris]